MATKLRPGGIMQPSGSGSNHIQSPGIHWDIGGTGSDAVRDGEGGAAGFHVTTDGLQVIDRPLRSEVRSPA